MFSFFLFKQKTAYEMRISDWSSDVCSSDLIGSRQRACLGERRIRMTEIERRIAQHYTHGALEHAILDGLKMMGRAPGDAQPEDLAGIDEFHMGGHRATADLAEQLDLRPGMSLLDIGCGIGGAARFFARSEEHPSELQSLMR